MSDVNKYSILYVPGKGYVKSVRWTEGDEPTFTPSALDAKKYPYCTVWYRDVEMDDDIYLLEQRYGLVAEEHVLQYNVYRG